MPALRGVVQRLRSMRRRSGSLSETASENSKNQLTQDEEHQPPPGPPSLPALLPVELPLIIPPHRYNLHDQGWSTVTFESSDDELFKAYQTLFAAAKIFFDRSLEYKSKFLTNEGPEEGWSRVEGEKELITLRKQGFCPEELAYPAGRVWKLASQLLNSMLRKIEDSLELSAGSLTAFSEPCSEFDGTKRATMLRIFRYENWESKIVAEPHNDLGLLSLVIGDIPGLEVWNKYDQTWFPVERSYVNAWRRGDERPKASVLVGRQLQNFSNGRYIAGGHLVRSYSDYQRMNESWSSMEASQRHQQPSERAIEQQDSARAEQDAARLLLYPEKRYRFSIVFVLRAHWPVPVNTDRLTTRITGLHVDPIKDQTAGQLFARIRNAHFNINTCIEEREEQKTKIRSSRKETGNKSASPAKIADVEHGSGALDIKSKVNEEGAG